MAFEKQPLTVGAITDMLNELLSGPSGNQLVQNNIYAYSSSAYLKEAGSRLAQLIMFGAYSYSAQNGFEDIIWAIPGDEIVRVTQSVGGKTVVSVSFRKDDISMPSLYPPKYPAGAYDMIGLMTQGYTSHKYAFAYDTVYYNKWHPRVRVNRKEARTSHRLGSHLWGFRPSSFVRDAIRQFEMEYAQLGAKVVQIPDTWR